MILLHGFAGNAADNMGGISRSLANQGCVFALTYATGRFAVRRAARHPPLLDGEFGPFVDDVLAHTGARQVDVVSHSEVACPLVDAFGRRCIRRHAQRSRRSSGVGPATHGADLGKTPPPYRSIPFFAGVIGTMVQNSCGAQVLVSTSSFLKQLNSSEPSPANGSQARPSPSVPLHDAGRGSSTTSWCRTSGAKYRPSGRHQRGQDVFHR